MAEGFELGKAFLKVSPDSANFKDELRAQLAKDNTEVRVKAKPDTRDFKSEMTAQLAKDKTDMKVKVSPDGTDFKAKLEAILLKDRTGTSVRLKVDSKDANNQIDNFSKKLDKLGKKLQGSGGPSFLGPLLTLLPTVASLFGVAAGAATALAATAVTGGIAVGAFGAVAFPVFKQAQTAQKAVTAAQAQYTVNIQNGMAPAKAYRIEMQAINKAYAGMSPAQIELSKQLGNLASAWRGVQKAETPVISSALTPWIKGLTDLVVRLNPIVTAVAHSFRGLGLEFDRIILSPSFTKFRDFIAGTGSQVTTSVGNFMLTLFKSLILVLPQLKPFIDLTTEGIDKLGRAIYNWSASEKPSQEIRKFLAWFKENGPVVGHFLLSIANLLKTLLLGLAGGSGANSPGILELKALTDLFNFIARLPQGWVSPISEAVGLLLIANKLGIVKVGLKLVGLAPKVLSFLTGGAISFGGMQKPADTMLIASGAMQKAADKMLTAAGATKEGSALNKVPGVGGTIGKTAEQDAGGLAGLLPKAGVIGAILAAIAAIGIAMYELYNHVKAVHNALNDVGRAFENTFNRIRNFISSNFDKWWVQNGTMIKNIWSGVVNFVKNLWMAIVPSFKATLNLLVNIGKIGFAAIKAAFKTAWDVIVGVFTVILDLLTGRWRKALTDMKNIGVQIWNNIRDLLKAVWNGLVGIATGSWRAIYNAIHGAWQGMLNDTKAVWTFIVNFLKGLWNGLATAANVAWRAIYSTIHSAWQSIIADSRAVWNAIFNLLKNIWNNIVDAAKVTWHVLFDVLHSGWQTIANDSRAVWNGIVSFLRSIWNALKDLFAFSINVIRILLKGAWSAITSDAHATWNALTSFFKTIWNGIKGIFDSVTNAIRTALHSTWTFIENDIHAVWNRVIGFFHTVWSGLRTGFQNTVNAIGSIWNRMKSIVGTPINVVLTKIYDPIANIFDKVTSFLGLGKPLPQAAALRFAEGGIVPGPKVKKDIVPALLMPDEIVLSHAQIANMGGHENVARMAGIPATNTFKDGVLHAAGGSNPFSSIAHAVSGAVSGVTGAVKGAVNAGSHAVTGLIKDVVGLGARLVRGAISGVAKPLIDGFLHAGLNLIPGKSPAVQMVKELPITLINDILSWIAGQDAAANASGGVGSGSGADVAKYAKSFGTGKNHPYVLGGASPNGWDCSGFSAFVYEHFGYFPGKQGQRFGTSESQFADFTHLQKANGPQPGALVFFDDGIFANPGHVGVALNNTSYVGADSPSVGTVIRSLKGNVGFRIPRGGFITGGSFKGGRPGPGIPQNANQIAAFLAGHGANKVAIAGILGNIMQESGGDPNAGSNPPGKGLIQILGDPGGSVAQDLVRTWNYIQQNGGIGPVNAARTAAQAATIFSQKYERPGIPMLSNRIAFANDAFAHGYDNGGLLPRGFSMAYNGTNLPEVILKQDQIKQLIAHSASSGGHHQCGNVTVIMNGSQSSPEEVAQAVYAKQQLMRRRAAVPPARMAVSG